MMKRFLLTSLFLVTFILASQNTPTVVSAQDTTVAETPYTVIPTDKMNEAWWKARHEENCARIAQGNVDLLLIGDSITNGWDTRGKEVRDFFYGDRNCVNMGFGGDQTQNVLWRLNNAPMENIQPKAAMLLVGVNSLWEDWKTDYVALGIQACVDKLQALYPDIKILVLDIFVVLEPGICVRQRAADASSKMRELMRDYKNVQFMDLNDLWLDEKNEIPRELMFDQVHPTREGYILWGKRVEPVIAEMLGVEAKEWT
ncbi:MAG: GDSL-type esterase/lipase family protein [Planctomycetia bacterium]|nr:GDSL-type esterase/lipase family protein [Planctomycetia bacterium]